MTINFVPWTNEIPFYKEDAKSLIISTGSKNPGNSIVLRPAWKTILYVFQLIRQKVAERKFSLTWRSNRIKSLLPLEVKIREITLRCQTEKNVHRNCSSTKRAFHFRDQQQYVSISARLEFQLAAISHQSQCLGRRFEVFFYMLLIPAKCNFSSDSVILL